MHSHHHSHSHHAHGHHGAHAHGHHHHHPGSDSPRTRRVLVLAILLNVGFVLTEFAAGWKAGSTALIADAGHNLSDVLGLLMALAAVILHRRQTSDRFTYGWRSTSILAALANAMLLLIACGAIGWEAIGRLVTPSPVQGDLVAGVAAAGIVINGGSAWLLHRESGHDSNMRAAFLHLALDAAVSVAVVMGGLIVRATGLYWLDPALSLAIVLLVLISTWSLLQEALRLALNAVPAHVDLQAVRDFLLSQRGVSAIDDLHIWGMSTTETAMTAHLVMQEGFGGDEFLDAVSAGLEQHFRIQHATLQLMSRAPTSGCVLLRP